MVDGNQTINGWMLKSKTERARGGGERQTVWSLDHRADGLDKATNQNYHISAESHVSRPKNTSILFGLGTVGDRVWGMKNKKCC